MKWLAVARLGWKWINHQAGQAQALSVDIINVKCEGQQRIVVVATTVLTGQPITLDLHDRSAFDEIALDN